MSVSLQTMRYWMERAIERDLHLSPPQAEEGRAALQQCLALAEASVASAARVGELEAALVRPVDMLLWCPQCGEQHVDEAKPDVCETCGGIKDDFPKTEGLNVCICAVFTAWLNPPHKSHRCAFCNHVFRPADVPTNGVLAIQTKGERDGNPRPRYFYTAKDYENAVTTRLTTIAESVRARAVAAIDTEARRIRAETDAALDWRVSVAAGCDHAAIVISRLDLAEIVAGGGWLPIESAPKDGSQILLAIDTSVGNVFVGLWSSANNAWFTVGESSGGTVGKNHQPTHWQPLPLPVAAPGDGGE